MEENDLVNRLAQGEHAIAAGGPAPSIEQLKESIDRQYVFINFTDTVGGTHLGIQLDPGASTMQGADFTHGTGVVHLEGSCVLDDVSLRCIADIDLATLSGTGRVQLSRAQVA